MSGSWPYITTYGPDPPVPDWLRGVSRAVLEQWLAQARGALVSLTTGTQAVRVSYSEGGGSRQVEYTRANIGDLRAMIRELSSALGHSRRRAIGVRFP
ncbi:MAG TPA: gpW family head-tail joining protein [Acetobacteraceae bacterium]|nr:gpW family head-tail joining protein [Acetobacteraceae bacterium]